MPCSRAMSTERSNILTSVLLLSMAWPIMLITALAIWMETGRPVFYRQIRVGRNNRNFEILKFRSMTVDAEKAGAQFAQAGDARVTKVGQLIRKMRNRPSCRSCSMCCAAI